MSQVLCRDWRELSEAASQEKDPKKFMELIEELNKVLDQHERDLRRYDPGNQDDTYSSVPSVVRPSRSLTSI
jgi:hypothetical protein